MVCMTCWEMYGNGVRIGMIQSTTGIVPKRIPRVRLWWRNTSCVVVHSIASPDTCACLIALLGIQITIAPVLVSAVCATSCLDTKPPLSDERYYVDVWFHFASRGLVA